MARTEVVYVDYQCAQCGEADRGKFFLDEQPWRVMNCWSCGAGRGKDLKEMIARGIGMFPVQPEQPEAA